MSEDVNFELNDANVMWLNEQHEKIQKGNKTLLNIALEMGERLVNLQKCHSGTFDEWLETANLNFSRTTAFRYMKLFKNREKISEAKSISEAYEILGIKKSNKKDDSDDDAEKQEPQAVEKQELQVTEKQEPQAVEKEVFQVTEKQEPQVSSNLETLSPETGLLSRLEVIRNEISKSEKLKELHDIAGKSLALTGNYVKDVYNFHQNLKKINSDFSDIWHSLIPSFHSVGFRSNDEVFIKQTKSKIEDAIKRLEKNYNKFISNLNKTSKSC